MSVTIASGHSPCFNSCKHACLIHLQLTRIHILYINIQPSVLPVLATDQRCSNGRYNCTWQADPYQLAVKMAANICSMQIPHSAVVFCVDTLHSISIFCKFYPSIQLTFSHIDSKKGLYFYQTVCHKVFSDVIHSVYPFIYHFIL